MSIHIGQMSLARHWRNHRCEVFDRLVFDQAFVRVTFAASRSTGQTSSSNHEKVLTFNPLFVDDVVCGWGTHTQTFIVDLGSDRRLANSGLADFACNQWYPTRQLANDRYCDCVRCLSHHC